MNNTTRKRRSLTWKDPQTKERISIEDMSLSQLTETLQKAEQYLLNAEDTIKRKARSIKFYEKVIHVINMRAKKLGIYFPVNDSVSPENQTLLTYRRHVLATRNEEGVEVPLLELSGEHLRKYGFEANDKVHVEYFPDKIIITNVYE